MLIECFPRPFQWFRQRIARAERWLHAPIPFRLETYMPFELTGER